MANPTKTEVVTQEVLPKHVEEIISPDSKGKIHVTPYGGQVWSFTVKDRAGKDYNVLYPLTKLHSIVTDWRDGGNTFPEGETSFPGGTFLSFGGGEIIDDDGEVRRAPVHGPFSAPWNKYKILRQSSGRARLVMEANPGSDFGKFFKKGEKYHVSRKVSALSAENHNIGSMVLTNTISNVGEQDVDAIPEAVEHTYYASGASAVIRTADGKSIAPQDIYRTVPNNGNAIDTRMSTVNITKTPGQVVFLPDGEDGKVIVIEATVKTPQGSMKVDEFCIYRYGADDNWTAIEPSIRAITLAQNESVTLTTTIQVFDKLADFEKTQVKDLPA